MIESNCNNYLPGTETNSGHFLAIVESEGLFYQRHDFQFEAALYSANLQMSITSTTKLNFFMILSYVNSFCGKQLKTCFTPTMLLTHR